MVVSPSWLPFFLSQPSVLAPTKGGAGCGPPDKCPPEAPQWPFLFARFNFERIDRPDSAHGRQIWNKALAMERSLILNFIIWFQRLIKDSLPTRMDIGVSTPLLLRKIVFNSALCKQKTLLFRRYYLFEMVLSSFLSQSSNARRRKMTEIIY